MRLTTTVGAALAAGALVASAVACSDPPKSGTVTSNEYNKAHYEEYIYCAAYTTTTVNGITSTSCSLYLPGQYWVKDKWKIKLLSDDGKQKGWRGVPQQIFDRCPIDAHYPGCAHDRGY